MMAPRCSEEKAPKMMIQRKNGTLKSGFSLGFILFYEEFKDVVYFS